MPQWRSFTRAVLLGLVLSVAISNQALAGAAPGTALGKSDIDFRSHARELADFVAQQGLAMEDEGQSQARKNDAFDRDDERGLRNVQVNDPALDHIQTFAGTRPFEFSIQSETSIAAFEDTVLVGYNSSADQPVVQTASGQLVFVHRHFSGFSVSHDRGRTWTSGFIPAVPGSPFTFGDPSVGVDRAGNFYYASLGTIPDANQTGAVIVGKSTDGGNTFGAAVVAALDDGSDKEWLGIGPDPSHPDRDNLYVAWTSFQTDAKGRTVASELRLTMSTDGGQTWTSKTLFAPTDGGPTGLSAFIQFANPVVDASSGRLYIPFLHFSNFDADFIKVLVSDDAGATFRFLEFNVPGAPDRFGFPNVTPGTIADCGRNNGGIRLVLHQGPNLGGGRLLRGVELPRFRQATRLTTQPSAAAAEGKLFLAFNSSTSAVSGDPASRSEIHALFSPDGGATFVGPITVAAATNRDRQHVLPSLSIDEEGDHVVVAYYVQQADGKIRVDMASGEVDDHALRFDREKAQRVSSVGFDLIPSNNPLPVAGNPFFTTNYDRTVRACYNLGEYIATTVQDDRVLAAWGDNRNLWTSPAGSPAAGTHAQPDVFFQRLDLD